MHLYTQRVADITWAAVEAFCQTRTTENAYLDYKVDFPTDLAKTVSAIANTFGGLVLIGVAEDNQSRPVLPITGISLQRGLEERVLNTLIDSVTPPIIPEIAVCQNDEGDRGIIVIRVAQSTYAPHALNANTRVYLRTGKRSSPEELADLERIRWLTDHRKTAEQLRETLLTRASDRFYNLRDGHVPGVPQSTEALYPNPLGQPGVLTLSL